MSGTLNSQAIKVANSIMQASQLAIQLTQMITVIDAAWIDIAAANAIAAMATTAVNADGSAGASDGAPNVAHPINTTTYPQLSQGVSSNQIASAKTILDAIGSLVAGNAVSAQPSARAILTALING